MSLAATPDVRAEGILGLVVAWDSQESLERHIRSELFWKVLSLMEMSSTRPDIRFHTVNRTTGLEAVERIRGAGRSTYLQNRPEGDAPPFRHR